MDYSLAVQQLNLTHTNTALKNITFDITRISDFTTLKELIRKFIPDTVGTGDFAYTEDEYKNWAAYVEFKNFNVFINPNIEIKSELNKGNVSMDHHRRLMFQVKMYIYVMIHWKVGK